MWTQLNRSRWTYLRPQSILYTFKELTKNNWKQTRQERIVLIRQPILNCFSHGNFQTNSIALNQFHLESGFKWSLTLWDKGLYLPDTTAIQNNNSVTLDNKQTISLFSTAIMVCLYPPTPIPGPMPIPIAILRRLWHMSVGWICLSLGRSLGPGKHFWTLSLNPIHSVSVYVLI